MYPILNTTTFPWKDDNFIDNQCNKHIFFFLSEFLLLSSLTVSYNSQLNWDIQSKNYLQFPLHFQSKTWRKTEDTLHT